MRRWASLISACNDDELNINPRPRRASSKRPSRPKPKGSGQPIRTRESLANGRTVEGADLGLQSRLLTLMGWLLDDQARLCGKDAAVQAQTAACWMEACPLGCGTAWWPMKYWRVCNEARANGERSWRPGQWRRGGAVCQAWVY